MKNELINEDRKNYEDEIDLVELLKILKKQSKVIIGIFLTITLISIAFGKIKYDSTKRVTTIISYNFNEISEGTNPDGSKFNPNLVASNEVLNRVIKENGIDNLSLSVVELREKISIVPIVPIYIRSKIKEELERGINSSYNPTAYEIKIEVIKDIATTKKILQALIIDYSNYYSTKYAQSDIIHLGKLVEGYEYQDYIRIFESKLNDIEVLLNAKQDQGFVSKQTGIGFARILSDIELIKDVDIKRINQYVVVDGLSKNKEVASKSLEYEMKILENKKQKKINEVEALNGILKLYKPEETRIVMNGNSGAVMEQNQNEYYSKLIEQVASAAIEVGNITEDIKMLENRKTNINNTKNVNKTQIDEALIELENKTVEIIGITNKVLNEYNARFVSNYIKTNSPVKEVADGKKMLMIIAIGMVLGLFLGIFVAFTKEFISNIKLKEKK